MKMELERYITIYNETTTIIIKMKKKKRVGRIQLVFWFYCFGKKNNKTKAS
jgi:hypothetical protein